MGVCQRGGAGGFGPFAPAVLGRRTPGRRCRPGVLLARISVTREQWQVIIAKIRD